jgi:hypothetical protein
VRIVRGKVEFSPTILDSPPVDVHFPYPHAIEHICAYSTTILLKIHSILSHFLSFRLQMRETWNMLRNYYFPTKKSSQTNATLEYVSQAYHKSLAHAFRLQFSCFMAASVVDFFLSFFFFNITQPHIATRSFSSVYICRNIGNRISYFIAQFNRNIQKRMLRWQIRLLEMRWDLRRTTKNYICVAFLLLNLFPTNGVTMIRTESGFWRSRLLQSY